jgi:hypothetical protein
MDNKDMDIKEKIRDVISIIISGMNSGDKSDSGAKFIDKDGYHKIAELLGIDINGDGINNNKRKVYNALSKLISDYSEVFGVYGITEPKYSNVSYYNGQPILFRF